MTGASIIVDIDTREVDELLRKIDLSISDIQPVLRDIGEYLLRSHDERFRSGVDPKGSPWQELSPAYKARKTKNKDKVLVLSGDLMDSLSYNISGSQLSFGTNKLYGATHQFGRDAIPARPFIGLSSSDTDEILRLIQNHLQNSLE